MLDILTNTLTQEFKKNARKRIESLRQLMTIKTKPISTAEIVEKNSNLNAATHQLHMLDCAIKEDRYMQSDWGVELIISGTTIRISRPARKDIIDRLKVAIELEIAEINAWLEERGLTHA